jgi:hypothetical protein
VANNCCWLLICALQVSDSVKLQVTTVDVEPVWCRKGDNESDPCVLGPGSSGIEGLVASGLAVNPSASDHRPACLDLLGRWGRGKGRGSDCNTATHETDSSKD